MAGSAAAFFGLLAFLAFQLGAGRDPALGAGEAAASKPARQVVVRKVRRHVVVQAPSGTAGSTGGVAPAPAPATSAPAPAAAAPAPAPPPVTRSS